MSPKHPDFDRGVALLRSGDAEGAITLLARADRRQRDPEVRYWLGEALLAARRPAEAVEPLRKAASDAPGAGRIRLALIRALGRNGDKEEAVTAASAALGDLGDDADFCVAAIGIVRREIGVPDAVTAVARKALALNPRDPRIETMLAGALSEAGGHEEAVAMFERILRRGPRTSLALYNVANALKNAGALDRAEAHYLEALSIEPGLASALGNLGNLYLDLGRTHDALAMLRRRHLVRRRDRPDPRDPSFTTATPEKLLHDADQFDRLVEHGRIDARFRDAAAAYRRIAQRRADASPRRFELDPTDTATIGPIYNRLHYLADGEAIPGPAVSVDLDWPDIERRYAASGPGFVWVDDFLTSDALARLQTYCLDSTVWHGFGYANRYLGSMIEDGFAAPLVAQIATELKARLPTVIGGHHLRKAWGFKYDPITPGIRMHADFAAVNVNFWITPDSSNRNAESGGLLIHPVEAPKDWNFTTFNSDNARIDAFLQRSDAPPIRVPYRRNRAVIFNSDLFHKTDDVHFGTAYADRRINVTMLYGRREDT